MTAPTDAGLAVDRYRRAAFRLAAAAKDLAAAARDVAATRGSGVVPAAQGDVEHARRLLAELPAVRVREAKAKES